MCIHYCRSINEELDSSTHEDDPTKAFNSSLETFKKYHQVYKERILQWPTDPLDIILNKILKKLPQTSIIADFGCGEAKISASLPNKVHSFDIFALNDRVTVCDMSKTPLAKESVDCAVFCLSLMGTEVGKFINEASRILKMK